MTYREVMARLEHKSQIYFNEQFEQEENIKSFEKETKNMCTYINNMNIQKTLRKFFFDTFFQFKSIFLETRLFEKKFH
jgi:hypothetical protein